MTDGDAGVLLGGGYSFFIMNPGGGFLILRRKGSALSRCHASNLSMNRHDLESFFCFIKSLIIGFSIYCVNFGQKVSF